MVETSYNSYVMVATVNLAMVALETTEKWRTKLPIKVKWLRNFITVWYDRSETIMDERSGLDYVYVEEKEDFRVLWWLEASRVGLGEIRWLKERFNEL
ncbi:unnamed protein product [Dovyalis caffra]|uniref:Uncharacterized protein n=1 Tax=Dovyalis caffra TaxID=77055 RepID=A0AAV1R5A6_9ROSI|nr:unnamed protein product [Dovyalis caffra]